MSHDTPVNSALDMFLQDVRYGVRILKKRPGYATVVTLTLALAIGSTTALFTLVNGVLLRPLPYPDSDRLVALYQANPTFERGSIAYPNFLDWQRGNRTFMAMAAYRETSFSITGGRAERAEGEMVSAEFFRILGVQPILGRIFTPGEDRLGAPAVVLISEGLWRRRFGGVRDIAGQRIRLNGNSSTIIGVIPASFRLAVPNFGKHNDIYFPIGQWTYPGFRDRSGVFGMGAIGRVRPGIPVARARSDMESVALRLAATYPESDRLTTVTVVPLRRAIVGDIQPLLLTLFGAVLFVLLIACVNVASLQLAHSTARTTEFAIRAALGARPRRLIRQMLTENTLLSLAGGIAGLLLARWGTQFCLSAFPSGVPRTEEVGLDWRVLAFTIGISIASGTLLGLAPALMSWKPDLQNSLRTRDRSLSSAFRRAQAAFVVAELALALSLLVGAGLVLRSMANLSKVDPGFETRNLVWLSIGLPPGTDILRPDAIRAIYRDLHNRLNFIPGVDSVSFSWGSFPMAWSSEALFWVEGQPKPDRDDQMNLAQEYAVEPEYFAALKLRLQRGRFFAPQDQERAPHVAVIDDRFVNRYFPREDPIGKHIQVKNGSHPREIVGVVGHVKQWGLDKDESQPLQAQLYYPFMQMRDEWIQQSARVVDVVMRTRETPAALLDGVRRTVQQMDGDQVVFGGVTMDEIVRGSLAPQRFTTILLSGFAAMALLLASIGVHGIVSYTVARRGREFGIRMALGGQRSHVLRLVLIQNAKISVIGIVLGFAGARALTRVLTGLLFGVAPTDPGVFTAVGGLFFGIAMLACYFPARRATRVDSMAALRNE